MPKTDESTVPRANGVSSTEDVYTRLREAVLNGEIAPGSVISQVKLARELRVSPHRCARRCGCCRLRGS